MAPLHGLYGAGELTALHAIATPYRERSHFDGQDVLENGAHDALSADDGWLNRALGLLGDGERRLGLAVGQGIPLVLRGEAPVASWAPQQMPEADDGFLRHLSRLYATDPILGPALTEAVAARRMTDAVLGDSDMTGKRRRADTSVLVKAASRLLADARGPRVAVFDIGGWDTHANQGTAQGQLANRLKGLGEALVGLKTGMGAAWSRTAVIVVTEFGRTAAANGTRGTDHGTASAALLLGGAVDGGRVVTDWPGLDRSRLYQDRDLAPTTDMRALFAAALIDHLGLPASDVAKRVFPEFAGRPLHALCLGLSRVAPLRAYRGHHPLILPEPEG